MNNQHYIKIGLLAFIICLLNGAKVSAEVLAPGLEYHQYTSDSQQILYVLTLDPKKVILKSVHANNNVKGVETVSFLAKQANAIAAINGGFFHMGEKLDGLPAGILKIDGRWFGIAYGARGALAWSNGSTPVLMDRVQTKTSLELNGHAFPVQGLNQPGHLKRAIVYTDAYGVKAGSLPESLDIVVHNDQIQAIQPGGNTDIPRGGFVYSLGPEAKRPNIPLWAGVKAALQIKVMPLIKKDQSEYWQQVENIMGGAPLLIEGGRIVQDYTAEKIKTQFSHQDYARTAVGILPSGHWVWVVVEKSRVTNSPGMTLPELAAFLQKLGCQMAINLDGGGSSTLYVNGRVVNNPENELDENLVLPIARPVANAILVLPMETSK